MENIKNIKTDDLDALVNAVNKRQSEKSMEQNIMDIARRNSVGVSPRHYRPKKKKISKTVVTLALATLVAASALGGKIGYDIKGSHSAPIKSEAAAYVDKLVDDYKKEIGAEGDYYDRVVTVHSHDKHGNPNEDYNSINLASKVIEASKKSKVDVLCVLIAAWNEIQPDFREKVFQSALNYVAEDKQDKAEYIQGNNAAEILNSLGYFGDNFEMILDSFREDARTDASYLSGKDPSINVGKGR